MKRREFIKLIAGSTAAWPLAAYGQQQGDQVRALQIRILHMQAKAVAAMIGQFIREIEAQVGWTTQLPWSASTFDQRRFDGSRLLRQVPAITELSHSMPPATSSCGCRASPRTWLEAREEYSKDPKFTEAVRTRSLRPGVFFPPSWAPRRAPIARRAVYDAVGCGQAG